MLIKAAMTLAILASGATFVDAPSPADAPSSPKKVRVVMLADCGASCTCFETTGLTFNWSACADVQSTNAVEGEDGCCGPLESAGCPAAPASGCLMDGRDGRIKYVGGDGCTCTQWGLKTGGIESPESQGGISVGVWSNYVTLGGFGIDCNSTLGGDLTATCSAGNNNTFATITYTYNCGSCGGF